MARRVPLLAGTAAVAVAIATVVALTVPRQSSQEQEVRGILVDVQSRDIIHAESITLREPNGALHVFTTSPEVADNPEHPTTASHLRLHLTGGIPVLVRYRSASDGPVATRVLDAESSP